MNDLVGRQTRSVLCGAKVKWIGIAVLAIGALSVGCGGEDKSGSGRAGVEAPVPKEIFAKVSGVRASTWLENMLTARGPEGKRRLAPGDSIASGETLVTAAGLEATLELSDRTRVVVAENTEVSLFADGSALGLELLRGEIRVSRPLDTSKSLWLGSKKNKATLGPGRFLATAEKNASTTLFVEAGWAQSGAGQTLLAGRRHVIGGMGAVAAPRVPAPSPPPRIVATPLAPLVPKELVPAPRRVPVRGIGTLVARDPRTRKKNGEALDLTLHRVRVTVRDGIARTEIEEAFTNKSKRTVEGIYKFVLPGGASITRLALDVSGRIEEGEVLEKKRAKRVFKSIVEDSVRPRDPALLEWERSGSFSMRIFPITGGQTRRVFLSYMQPLTAKDGVYEYVYPMSSPAGTAKIGRFEIDIDAALSRDIASVTTPLMEAKAQTSGKTAEVTFAAEGFSPSTDFAVRFASAIFRKEARIASETDVGGRTYAMALLSPRIPQAAPRGSRRVVAMVDSSYGIPEELLDLAKQSVLETAATLGPSDELAVLACDSDCRIFEAGFSPVSASSVIPLAAWLEGIEPGGASNLLGGFAQVFELAKSARPVDVIYLGDGSPTAGATEVPELVRLLQSIVPSNVSVHTVGLGANREELALKEIAARLGGAFHRPMVGAAPQHIAAALARGLGGASLKNVTITWPAGVESAYPTHLGTLASGQEIAVVARLSKPALEGDLVLRGTDGSGRIVERRFPLRVRPSAPQPSAVAKLWARRHFDALTLAPERENEIVALSRQMKIASRYTSWIVLENDRMYRQFGIERLETQRWDGQAPEFKELEEMDDLTGDFSYEIKGQAAAGYGRGASIKGGSTSRFARKKGPRPSVKASSAAAASAADFMAESVKRDRPDFSSAEKAPVYEILSPGRYHRVRFFSSKEPSAKALERARQAAANVESSPLVRTHHQRYLRLLARQGRVEDQLIAAKSWIEKDPLEPSALRAFADALARNGERERALRFYGGITELRPSSPKIHRRLGAAHRYLGRYIAAAGHYRAAASSKRGTEDDWQSYFECLTAAGLHSLFNEETRLVSSHTKSLAKQERIKQMALRARAQSSDDQGGKLAGPFKIRLQIKTGTGEDVDLAVIDPGGRRISGAWPRNAAVRHLTDPTKEALALSWIQEGVYRVLVSRSRPSPRMGPPLPVAGTITVRCKHKRQSFPFTLEGAETEVVRVSYREVFYK